MTVVLRDDGWRLPKRKRTPRCLEFRLLASAESADGYFALRPRLLFIFALAQTRINTYEDLFSFSRRRHASIPYSSFGAGKLKRSLVFGRCETGRVPESKCRNQLTSQ